MLGLRDLVLIAPTPSLHHHGQQQPQPQQPISQDHHLANNLPLSSSAASLSVGLGIFPLLTATPCMPQHPHTTTTTTNNNNNNVQDQQECANTNYWNLKMCPQVEHDDGSTKHLLEGEEEEENNGIGIYGPDFRVCHDCGNRAKKDCSYKRCRTCCKGRGYDCSTHVKSTWVSASRRRERHVALVAGSGSGSGVGGDGGGTKRLRALGSSHNAAATTTSHSSTSNATTTTKSLDTSSYHQDAGFKQSLPGHVRAPAVFRCHRVSAIGNGEDEFAYLATVHISGHVFKGYLYDHGVDGKNEVPCVSELQLGNNGGGKNNGECSSAIGVPTSAYPASAC